MSDTTTAFTSLLKRLETATQRLEDLAVAGSVSSSLQPTSHSNTSASNLPMLEQYDAIISGPLQDYLKASLAIDGIVKEQSVFVEKAFQAQRHLLQIASQCKKPDMTSSTFSQLLKPTQEALEKIVDFREKNRSNSFFNHLSTVSEGISAVGWVAVEPTPVPYIGEMKDAAQFYSFRVIKEFKDKERIHVDWANSFINLLAELQKYVKQFHTTGVTWNAKGCDPSDPKACKAVSGQTTHNPVLAQLNQGSSVTACLKKVDKTQPRGPSASHRGEDSCKAKESETQRKPPRMELEGRKWVIENFTDKKDIVLSDVDLKKVVYIYNCNNCVIRITQKVNAISIDRCQKTGIVVDSVVSTIDVIHSKSMQLQILRQIPTVMIDTSESVQLFLSKEGSSAEVFSSKSSAINISMPQDDNPNSDIVEMAVPEQMKSVISNGKLQTTPVEHIG